MKKIYSTPVSVETKTRIRASILAGSNTGTNVNAGKAQESLILNSTSGGGSTQPQTQTKNGKMGFFGD